MSPDVQEIYEGDNDRTKFLFLLCLEDDELTREAAAGAIAILTTDSPICCRKLFSASQWSEVLEILTTSPSLGIQHRGIYVQMYNVCV